MFGTEPPFLTSLIATIDIEEASIAQQDAHFCRKSPSVEGIN